MNLLELLVSSAHAQAAPGAAEPSPFSPLIMIAVFFAVMYFMMIRPQSKRAKEHREMLAQLAKGDEVLAAGGLLGRVVELGDAFVSIELAQNLVVKVQKPSITAVLPKGTLKSV